MISTRINYAQANSVSSTKKLGVNDLTHIFGKAAPGATKKKISPGIVEGPPPAELLRNPKATMISIAKEDAGRWRSISDNSNSTISDNSNSHLMISRGPTNSMILCNPNDDQRSLIAASRSIKRRSPNSTSAGSGADTASDNQNDDTQPRKSRDERKADSESRDRSRSSQNSNRSTKNVQPQPSEKRRKKKRTEDEQHLAAGALTLLCKAIDGPSSKRKESFQTRNIPKIMEYRDRKQKQQKQKQQQQSQQTGAVQYNSDRQKELPKKREPSRKRNFIATLSKAPNVAHVPDRSAFRSAEIPMRRNFIPMAKSAGPHPPPPPPPPQPSQTPQRAVRGKQAEQLNYSMISQMQRMHNPSMVNVPSQNIRNKQMPVPASVSSVMPNVAGMPNANIQGNPNNTNFVPNPAPKGYFFGIVTSHGGTRKMTSLGIPTMVVRLANPQMHLAGFVVAGHVAWQELGNSTDQGNWSTARCLMCIRHPSALELMICDPTRVPPFVQHLYISPSHCVRRFEPNIRDLKMQLKMDMISLPLTKPELPFENLDVPHQNVPTGSAPPPGGIAVITSQNMHATGGPPRAFPPPAVAMLGQIAPDAMKAASIPARINIGYGNAIGVVPPPPQARRPDSKEYFCNICRKDFSCKSSLNRHMRIHSGVKPFQCNVCGKRFSDKGVLDVHERIHTGKKPYQCSQCSKVFSQKGNLKRHMRIHTGVRPYSCHLCQKAFSQKGHLTAHLRIHTGQKPYTCKFCHKSFTQSSTLIGHMRTHTGERPYRCNICQKTFRQKGNLTAHMVMHDMQNVHPQGQI